MSGSQNTHPLNKHITFHMHDVYLQKETRENIKTLQKTINQINYLDNFN